LIRKTVNNRIIWVYARVCFLLSVATLLLVCIGASKPPNPVYYYTLDYATPSVQLAQHLPYTLRVERFSVSPPFNSQRIIYAHKGLQRNAYAYHRWIVAPSELLPYFLARDLRQSNGFRAVMTPDASLSATHSLYGWVEEFIEKDASAQWQAAAIIHITLISNLDMDPTRKILLQKRYSGTAPCKAKTPEALAEAMSSTVAEISQAITKDVHNRLSTVETLKY
jgi:ABC-type uncharacterized transport system auxiliary subunit